MMSATPVQLTGTIIGTSGSYQNKGNFIAKVFDGKVSTFFDSASASGNWIGLDLGTAKVLTQISYASRSGYASRMNGGSFQASDDAAFGSGKVVLLTIPAGANPSSTALTNKPISNSTAYRYVRYLAPAGSYGNVSELQFLGTTEDSTEPVQVSGSVIGTTGSYQNKGNTIAKVFDGNLTTFFDGASANGNWAGLDLGSAKVIRQISFAPRAGYAGRMVSGVFQGASAGDFSTGVVNFLTINAPPAASAQTAVLLGNSTAFRYVRYLSPAGSYGNVADIRFFIDAPADPLTASLQHALGVAQTQIARTITAIASSSNYPQYTKADGSWSWVSATHWTSGFLPGELWQLFEATGNASYKTQATKFTLPIAAAASQTSDNGFRIFNTFYPLLQQDPGNASIINTMLAAANAKMSVYNSTVGAFKAWRTSTSGNPKANFSVLMDLIMDSSLLFWASQQTGDAKYYNAVLQNAITEQNYLVRADGGSAHFAYFDSATGEFVGNETYQGYSADSTWARGQAWGIYGFTACAAATGRADLLATAKKMADWYIAHLPANSVPFWDFNDPAIPNTYRDTSAAAVAASGLLKLSKLIQASDPTNAARYRSAAGKMLGSLANNYLADPAQAGQSVLLQGALNVPATPSINNTGVIFGDYYFLEGINAYLGGS